MGLIDSLFGRSREKPYRDPRRPENMGLVELAAREGVEAGDPRAWTVVLTEYGGTKTTHLVPTRDRAWAQELASDGKYGTEHVIEWWPGEDYPTCQPPPKVKVHELPPLDPLVRLSEADLDDEGGTHD